MTYFKWFNTCISYFKINGANFGYMLTFSQFKIEPQEDYCPDQYNHFQLVHYYEYYHRTRHLGEEQTSIYIQFVTIKIKYTLVS